MGACAGMIGCGMSGTFGQLLAWRWVTGIGSALQMAGAQLFLTDISLSTNRARTLGTNQARSLWPSLLILDCHSICCDPKSYRLQLLSSQRDRLAQDSSSPKAVNSYFESTCSSAIFLYVTAINRSPLGTRGWRAAGQQLIILNRNLPGNNLL